MTQPHPSLLKRKVIHVDMDCFYAAVEKRDDPSLESLPLIIGGSAERRGVVCTACYIARRYGVRSAMSMAKAMKLCPQARVLSPNFSKYREVSLQMREIFLRYVDEVETISLDEAFLDVTNHDLYAVQIGLRIRESIAKELGVTCSVGVGPNKMIAKISSDYRKPNGITVVTPDLVAGFMAGLSLRKIPGVGPVTESKLQADGLRICRDVLARGLPALELRYGQRMSRWLWLRSQGIDENVVRSHRERKSVSKERTFPKDILELSELEDVLGGLAQQLFEYMAKRGIRAYTLTLKVKYADFSLVTRRLTSDKYFGKDNVWPGIKTLLSRTEVGRRPVRLLGLGFSKLERS